MSILQERVPEISGLTIAVELAEDGNIVKKLG
jgi:hypothetical protein